ncbi:MAG: hypothetical protein RBQ63_03845 [Acholeplasmatales bacterium]|jgi:hypothetical protein|nr:hypothetical protein [Acholeplasmatales bacterium]MDY0339193.1 hypothetical protein [Acholeplasmataceae bacterium]
MERTKKNANQWENTRLPDAVNASPISDFTMVPNDILRNPEIGATAKTILCILLSNTDGWYSYKNTIMGMMKEGEHAITSGLKELERFDYLRRIKYRDKFTKQWRGSFWAYTTIPGEFNISHNIELMERKELEMFFETSSDIVEGNSETIDSSGDRATTWKPTYGKPTYGKPTYGKPTYGKPSPKNINNKNTNNNKSKGDFSNSKYKHSIKWIHPSEEFKKAWILWLAYKKAHFHFDYSDKSTFHRNEEQIAMNKLDRMSDKNESKAICIIKQSIENGWQGFHPIKQYNGKFNKSNRPGNGHIDLEVRKTYITKGQI